MSNSRSAIRRESRAGEPAVSPTKKLVMHPRPVLETYRVIRDDQSTHRRKESTESSSFTTGALPAEETHQMSRNSSAMTVEMPAALDPTTLRLSLTLVVLAALAAFAVR